MSDWERAGGESGGESAAWGSNARPTPPPSCVQSRPSLADSPPCSAQSGVPVDATDYDERTALHAVCSSVEDGDLALRVPISPHISPYLPGPRSARAPYLPISPHISPYLLALRVTSRGLQPQWPPRRDGAGRHSYSRRRVARFLIEECGASVNALDRWGFTCLQDAARSGRVGSIGLRRRVRQARRTRVPAFCP